MFDYPKKYLLYLQEMGIPFYVRRNAVAAVQTAPASARSLREEVAVDTPSRADDGLAAVWTQLYAEVRRCSSCVLHEQRTQAVPGAGNVHADWMIVGEAPGFEEDRKGEPFVGRAGQLLNKMLSAIDLERAQVYITNIVKCRPPDNRNPRSEEIASCDDYLRRQIQMINPKIILALGRIAANALLDSDVSVGRLRGHVHYYQESELPIVVTYHPAYLLRSPQHKRAAWEDLQLARNRFSEALR